MLKHGYPGERALNFTGRSVPAGNIAGSVLTRNLNGVLVDPAGVGPALVPFLSENKRAILRTESFC